MYYFFEKKLKNLKKKLDLPPCGTLRLQVIKLKEVRYDKKRKNDYREYSLEDVRQLEKIKLLRKLSVPIEDIRLIESGKLSLSQSMKGQIERIEKEEQNTQVIGIIYVLIQRIKEINGGEEYDARNY